MNLTDYIRSLSDFTIRTDTRHPGTPEYEHMGALLTDAILQAGQRYKTIVRPRALRVRDTYPDADTTSGFLNVLEMRGYQEVLQWKDTVKPDRLTRLTMFFRDRHIETIEDLQKWLKGKDSNKELRKINGVGPKTADYLALLAGLPRVTVDRHIERFCAEAGIEKRDIKKAAKEAAEELGTDVVCLDYSIWFYMSQREK